MNNRKTKLHPFKEPADAGELLASRYGQLLRWAMVLTRGNPGKAEEIVQEFCVYIAVTKPDFGGVANLDGYLYTCLRNIYLSTLARASREALHLVSVEDYDSFAFAISANPTGDSLQRQNDLRRICSYAVWRKESAKSASYFILHFFHGYGRREIAELAQLPIAAIYNKLKTARSEVGHISKSPASFASSTAIPRPSPPCHGICSPPRSFSGSSGKRFWTPEKPAAFKKWNCSRITVPPRLSPAHCSRTS